MFFFLWELEFFPLASSFAPVLIGRREQRHCGDWDESTLHWDAHIQIHIKFILGDQFIIDEQRNKTARNMYYVKYSCDTEKSPLNDPPKKSKIYSHKFITRIDWFCKMHVIYIVETEKKWREKLLTRTASVCMCVRPKCGSRKTHVRQSYKKYVNQVCVCVCLWVFAPHTSKCALAMREWSVQAGPKIMNEKRNESSET